MANYFMISSHYPQIQGFLDYLKFEKRYSPHTIISYQTDLIQFFSFISEHFGNPPVENITAPFIRSWLAGLKENNVTSKSINRKISSLKSFFKFLMKQNLISQTPMTTVISPKINKRLPTFIDEKHLNTLLNYVEFTDDWKGKTEKLILELLYATGMRLSELINLKENHLDEHYSQLKVLGKGNKERMIPVQKTMLAKLHSYVQEKPAGLKAISNVFVNTKGKPLYQKYVYNLVKRNLSLVTTIEKKSPHILRHSFATHLANNGADLNAIKELLGHSSLAATQIYTHNTIKKLKEAFQKAHPKA